MSGCECLANSVSSTCTSRHALSPLSDLHLGESVPACARQLPTHCDTHFLDYRRFSFFRVCLHVCLEWLFILVDINWANRVCQQWQTCFWSLHEFIRPRVPMFSRQVVGQKHHHQQIFLVYDSFVSSSVSTTEFCLQENDRLSLFCGVFFMCISFSLTVPPFPLHSQFFGHCVLPSGTELHLHHLSLSSTVKRHFFLSFVIAYLAGKVVHFINRHLHLKKLSSC